MAVWLTGIRCSRHDCEWTHLEVRAGDPVLAAAFLAHCSEVTDGALHSLMICGREVRGDVVGVACYCGWSAPAGSWDEALQLHSGHAPHGEFGISHIEVMLSEPGDAEPSTTLRARTWTP